jgi:hypothetical protein
MRLCWSTEPGPDHLALQLGIFEANPQAGWRVERVELLWTYPPSARAVIADAVPSGQVPPPRTGCDEQASVRTTLRAAEGSMSVSSPVLRCVGGTTIVGHASGRRFSVTLGPGAQVGVQPFTLAGAALVRVPGHGLRGTFVTTLTLCPLADGSCRTYLFTERRQAGGHPSGRRR